MSAAPAGASSAHRVPPGRDGGDPGYGGRITIDDEVVVRIATLAALEVAGVVALTAREGPGRGGGVAVRLRDEEVSLDLGVAVEYGSVIMDVATAVRANVARVAGLMLGRRVAEVNVAVEDVRVPPGPSA
ncbi:Asp23/Gls24 family envelope stress response protein [Actinomadura yumaensis]|uniref:Asp23/Gls24 family envelope stress response protein n=1 Tax=Actinomadura yumaensis TaxID=111807 RepID=UPI00132AD0CB|nr:Asp23/Gls24 family envelope stress response protein [Actinomadura sp. J1-007]